MPDEYSAISDCISKKEYDDAEFLLNKILQDNPSDGQGNYLKGRLKLRQNDLVKAHFCFGIALQNGIEDFNCYLNLAIISKRLNNVEESNSHLYKAFDVCKDLEIVSHLSALSVLFLENQNYDGAHKVADFIITKHPNDYKSYSLKIHIYISQGSLSDALSLLANIEKLFAEQPMYIIDKTVVLHQCDKTEVAWNFLISNTDKLDITSKPYLQLQANLATKLRRMDDVMYAYRKLFELYNDTSAAVALGLYYVSKQNYNKADTYFKSAIQNPTDSKYYYIALYYHAVCMQHGNDENDAKESFYAAIGVYENRLNQSTPLETVLLLQYLIECYSQVDNKEKVAHYTEIIEKLKNHKNDN